MITLGILTVVALAVTGTLVSLHNGKEVRRARTRVEELDIPDSAFCILMPVCGRPHYLKRVLDALRDVEGIERALVVVSQGGHWSRFSWAFGLDNG